MCAIMSRQAKSTYYNICQAYNDYPEFRKKLKEIMILLRSDCTPIYNFNGTKKIKKNISQLNRLFTLAVYEFNQILQENGVASPSGSIEIEKKIESVGKNVDIYVKSSVFKKDLIIEIDGHISHGITDKDKEESETLEKKFYLIRIRNNKVEEMKPLTGSLSIDPIIYKGKFKLSTIEEFVRKVYFSCELNKYILWSHFDIKKISCKIYNRMLEKYDWALIDDEVQELYNQCKNPTSLINTYFQLVKDNDIYYINCLKESRKCNIITEKQFYDYVKEERLLSILHKPLDASKVYCLSSHDLIKLGITTNNIKYNNSSGIFNGSKLNRNINEKREGRVSERLKKAAKEYNSDNPFYPFTAPVIICYFDNKIHVIDGQHRLYAYTKYIEQHYYNYDKMYLKVIYDSNIINEKDFLNKVLDINKDPTDFSATDNISVSNTDYGKFTLDLINTFSLNDNFLIDSVFGNLGDNGGFNVRRKDMVLNGRPHDLISSDEKNKIVCSLIYVEKLWKTPTKILSFGGTGHKSRLYANFFYAFLILINNGLIPFDNDGFYDTYNQIFEHIKNKRHDISLNGTSEFKVDFGGMSSCANYVDLLLNGLELNGVSVSKYVNTNSLIKFHKDYSYNYQSKTKES